MPWHARFCTFMNVEISVIPSRDVIHDMAESSPVESIELFIAFGQISEVFNSQMFWVKVQSKLRTRVCIEVYIHICFRFIHYPESQGLYSQVLVY